MNGYSARPLVWSVVLGAHTKQPIAVVGVGPAEMSYVVLGRARWLYEMWLEQLGEFWIDEGALRDMEQEGR